MIRRLIAHLRRRAAEWRKAAAQIRRHNEILEQLEIKRELEQRDGLAPERERKSDDVE